jgi:hypothetical protein
MRTKKQIEAWLRSDEPWVDQKREGAVVVDYFYGFHRQRVMRVRLLRKATRYNPDTRQLEELDEAEFSRPTYYLINVKGWIIEDTAIKAMVDKVYEIERLERRQMMEDKKEITALLLKTLKATSYYYDLEDLVYEMHDDYFETVTAKYQNGVETVVNVSCDSGLALIKDVIRRLEEY